MKTLSHFLAALAAAFAPVLHAQTATATYLDSFGSSGAGDGQFVTPISAVVDPITIVAHGPDGDSSA
jgi:hypothetical protein